MCTLATEMNECALGPFCFDRLFVVAMRTKIRSMYGIKVSMGSNTTLKPVRGPVELYIAFTRGRTDQFSDIFNRP